MSLLSSLKYSCKVNMIQPCSAFDTRWRRRHFSMCRESNQYLISPGGGENNPVISLVVETSSPWQTTNFGFNYCMSWLIYYQNPISPSLHPPPHKEGLFSPITVNIIALDPTLPEPILRCVNELG